MSAAAPAEEAVSIRIAGTPVNPSASATWEAMIAVAGELLRIHGADIDRVDVADLRVGEGLLRSLTQNRRERARILAELRHAGTGDINRLHRNK